MKKADLIKGIAQKAGISRQQAQLAFEAALELIKKSVVEDNDKVVLPSFGTFSPSERAARTGRNPSTNEEMIIPACRVAKFKPSKDAWF